MDGPSTEELKGTAWLAECPAAVDHCGDGDAAIVLDRADGNGVALR